MALGTRMDAGGARLVLAAIGLLAAACLLPASADASRVKRVGNQLQVTAAPGEENNVDVTATDESVFVGDDSIDAGSGCKAEDDAEAECPLGSPAIIRVIVDVGDGDDSVAVDGPLRSLVLGGAGDDRFDLGDAPSETHAGPGNDEVSVLGEANTIAYGDGGVDAITGDDGNDTLFGGPGNDEIDGGGGSNRVSGDGGDDTLLAGYGSTEYSGGAGNDEVGYAFGKTAISVDLDGIADDGFDGNDNVLADVETMTTGDGADRLSGGYGHNDFKTYGGDDQVNVRGGGADRVACGDGDDRVVADNSDTVERDCEEVQRLADPQALTVRVERCKGKSATCIKVSCPREAKNACAGVASVAASAARRRVRKSAAKQIAAGPVSVAAGRTKELRLKPSIGRKALKRARKSRLTAKVVVADGDGATASASASYKLKR